MNRGVEHARVPIVAGVLRGTVQCECGFACDTTLASAAALKDVAGRHKHRGVKLTYHATKK